MDLDICIHMLEKGMSFPPLPLPPSLLSFHFIQLFFSPSDQKALEAEVSSLRDGLKPKVAELHRMEGERKEGSMSVPCTPACSACVHRKEGDERLPAGRKQAG